MDLFLSSYRYIGKSPMFAAYLLLASISIAFPQNHSPLTPVITEPLTDGAIVNPADVHMETAPFSDPDPEDMHQCSDWEIWTVTPAERVWVTLCIGGVNTVHTHLGDGIFENSHTGRSDLMSDTDYRLLVRHRDNSGDPTTEWSPWAERFFRTGASSTTFPLELDDIATTPIPAWKDTSGQNVVLPQAQPPASVRIETPTSEALLEIRSGNGMTNQLINPAALPLHKPVRAVLSGGSAGITLPPSELYFTDQSGSDRVLYLPSVDVPSFGEVYYWISSIGSSYIGDGSQMDPDFSEIARSSPVPWSVRQRGYKVEIVATGLQLPVNIAFIPNPGNLPNDPYFYVTELYGTIKLVLRNGTVTTYADSLLNFNPTGNFPGSGEQGLSGIAVDSATGDVIVAMLYDAEPPDGPHYPKVVRFHSDDGGRTASSQTTVLDMPQEIQEESHFISNLSIGPDRKLYVHMGDGFDVSAALDLESFRGKILRLDLNGSAPSDNPFYDSTDGITARDYIFAYGFRNPFGGSWRASDGFHYEVENGPTIDRFARVVPGTSYGWDGTDSSMMTNAIYNWEVSHAPVNVAFVQQSTFSGSRFPPSMMDHAFVTESGPTWATGPQSEGKRIVEFQLDATGNRISGPTALTEYAGAGKATAIGLCAGPDGLYFTDLYKDLDFETPIDRGASVLRIKYVGTVDFTVSATSGSAPLLVQFTDRSNVPGPIAWVWDFGDSLKSVQQNPVHVFTRDGVYNIRLSVMGESGAAVAQKNNYIIVGDLPVGLRGLYFNRPDLSDPVLTRIDPVIDFEWGFGPPSPSMNRENFSVRWTGRVKAAFPETYTFYTLADDGARLLVNGQLLINSWVDQVPTEHSGTIALQAGQLSDIIMEYYHKDSVAVAQLSWSSPSQPKEIIPQSRLYADGLRTVPAKVVLLFPTNQAKIKADSVTFVWYQSQSRVNGYWFEYSLDSFFTSSIIDSTLSDTTKTVSSLQRNARYYWRVKARNETGWGGFSEARSFSITTTGVEDEHQMPREFSLRQNYPNPFNPRTRIEYDLPHDAMVRLEVFNIFGQRVALLVDGRNEAGTHKIVFEDLRLASGVYFYRLLVDEVLFVRKMLLTK